MLPAFIAAAFLRILELTFRAGVHMHSNWMADQWVLSDLDTRDLLIAYEVCFLRRPVAARIGDATRCARGARLRGE